MIDWGRAFMVAFVGFNGVFAGLILLEICVNVLARVILVIEHGSISKEKS